MSDQGRSGPKEFILTTIKEEVETIIVGWDITAEDPHPIGEDAMEEVVVVEVHMHSVVLDQTHLTI